MKGGEGMMEAKASMSFMIKGKRAELDELEEKIKDHMRPFLSKCCLRNAGILALKYGSKILGHFNNPALHCFSVRFVGVASPPAQCSNTGLKMRNKKSGLLQCLRTLLTCFRAMISGGKGRSSARKIPSHPRSRRASRATCASIS